MENEHMDQIKNDPTKPPLDMEISIYFMVFQMQKQLYNYICLFVHPKATPPNSVKSIKHSSHILHPSFCNF